MARLSILLVFLFILFVQFNYQEASPVYSSTLDDIEDPRYPSHASSSLLNLWYDRLNNLEDNNEQQENLEHVWKRFSPDLIQLRQRRRFGNTRYGRSLPAN
jgi:hypothetical protein